MRIIPENTRKVQIELHGKNKCKNIKSKTNAVDSL